MNINDGWDRTLSTGYGDGSVFGSYAGNGNNVNYRNNARYPTGDGEVGNLEGNGRGYGYGKTIVYATNFEGCIIIAHVKLIP